MNHLIKLLAVLFCIPVSCFSQDTLVRKIGNNTDSIYCKIISITNSSVIYEKEGLKSNVPISTIVYSSKPLLNSTLATLPTKEVRMEDELVYMRKNLVSFNKQYKTGLFVGVTGSLVSAIGIIQTESGTPFSPLVYMGGGLAFIGGILMVDSHKFCKRAGIGIAGKGVTVKYTF